MNFESMIYGEIRSIHESGIHTYSSATDPIEREAARGWKDAAVAMITKISEHHGITFHEAMQRVYEAKE